MGVSKTGDGLATAGSCLMLAVVLVGCRGAAEERVVMSAPQTSTVMVEAPSLSPAEMRRFEESFEYVWTTIRDRHWDPEIGGVDWQAVHDELLPDLRSATSVDEARGVLVEMLARLGESHFNIVPSEVYEDVVYDAGDGSEEGAGNHDDEPKRAEADGVAGEAKRAEKRRPRAGDGQPGFDVRFLDGQMVVVSVEPDSPAARSGVVPGWVIRKIDGRSLERSLQGIETEYSERGLTALFARVSTLGRLSGPIGDRVPVEFLDGKDQPQQLDVELIRPQGEKTRLGHMPAVYANLSSRWLGDDVGYISLNVFMDPARTSTAFGAAVQEFMGAKGIIVDLRGNPGGIGAMAMGLAGWFIDRSDAKLGTMILRGTTLKFVVFPRAEVFAGKLAILVDECSASTSEIYAQGMKDLERARIFGGRTCGAALPSQFEKLPSGDGFQYAIANYVSTGGIRLEANGVQPDVPVALARAALLNGEDSVIEAAVDWIREPATN
ncbi:MAG: S41 family peptidase [Planctomycetota bacterium]